MAAPSPPRKKLAVNLSQEVWLDKLAGSGPEAVDPGLRRLAFMVGHATRRWPGFCPICYACPYNGAATSRHERRGGFGSLMDLIGKAYLAVPGVAAVVGIWLSLLTARPFSAILTSLVGALGGVVLVLGYWAAAKTHPNAIAGLIPWNDASAYLSCGRELIAGAAINPFCGMRPYYVAEFGAFLALSGGNLQIAVLLQAALLGGAVGWFSYKVSRYAGIIAGVMVYAALLIFSVEFTLPVLTENAGLLLGLLAMGILLQRPASILPLHFLVVLLLLTLALNARAGAMLVLPALLMWSAILSHGDRRQRMMRTLGGLCGIVGALALIAGLTQIVGGATARAHSNFAFTLYAIGVNKMTYLQVYFDHPQIVDAPDLTKAIYDLFWENLRSRPELLVLGYLQGGARWVLGWFEFVPVFHIRAVFFVLAFTGLWSCLTAWRGERERLLLVMYAAMAVSAPFLFPYGGSRILAATFPVDAVLVGYGLAYLLRRPVEAVGSETDLRWPVGIATSLALAPLLAVPLIRAAPILSPIDAKIECPARQQAFSADLRNESAVVTLGTPAQTSLFPLVVDRDAFVRKIHPATHLADELRTLPAGTSLVDAMQRLPGGVGNVAYAAPIRFLWAGPLPRGVVKGCADTDPKLWFPVGTRLELIGKPDANPIANDRR
jgi:hypothetical protein